ncbi:MAG: class I SAM-dependent methyltransferase [Magnetococcales bacterium]|nr:class I SAM-dependent methyltransferase [Magnetococcales bacterium]
MAKVELILKAGREKSLLRRHPWVFSGAVAGMKGTAQPGETVDIVDAKGKALARGAYSGRSQIVCRVWSFSEHESIDGVFFRQALEHALERRRVFSAGLEPNGGLRLVNAESDGLPGVVVDRYGEWLVGQFTSAGAQTWKGEIARILMELTGAKGLLERTEGEVCAQEGLTESVGTLAGLTPPETIPLQEHGLSYAVDPWHGHKTGFYLDQRDNRLLVREGCQGRRVLNTFAFSGGFGLNAMAAGAEHVTHLESSAALLSQAEDHARRNRLPEDRFDYCRGNAFHKLREWRDQRRTFDCIVLDPPRLADSQAGLMRAARAYKDLNWLALRLLAPGGRLLTFSCSGRVAMDLFAKVVADAAIDAGRHVMIQRYLGPPADHPVALTFPEGRYLKGLQCIVD